MRRRLLLSVFVAQLGAAGAARADTAEACVAHADAAQELMDAGHYANAIERLALCARDACPAPVRKDCHEWMAEVKRLQPTVVFAVTDPGKDDPTAIRVSDGDRVITTQLDGQPLPFDPGTHVFRFEMPGRPLLARTVLLRAGDKARLVEVHWDDPSSTSHGPPSPRRSSEASDAPWPRSGRGSWMPYALGGLSLIPFAVAGVLTLTAKNDISALERASCAPTQTCNPKDVDSVRGRLIAADVALGVGLVTFGVAVVWAIMDWRARHP